jgi:hypothetical protein
MRGILKLLLFGFFGVIVFSSNGYSQVKSEEVSTTCEYIKNALDYSIVDWTNRKDTSIIFIFHRGATENGKTIIKARMNLIEEYLNSKNGEISHVFAEGKPTTGLGRIDIFIEGKLRWQIVARKNDANICDKEPH